MKNLPGNPSDPDTLLDRVLDHALASYTPVAPRPGFELRLQARLAAEEAHSRRLRFSLPWVLAGAAILASAAGLLVLVHRSRIPAEPPAPAAARHSASPEYRNPGLGSPDDSARFHAEIKTLASWPAHRVRPASAIDRRTLEEMRAASHPAPEEPLTQQEKLLLRVVHKGDPQEMAMLNPEVRERQEKESEAEFHKFVEESIKGEHE